MSLWKTHVISLKILKMAEDTAYHSGARQGDSPEDTEDTEDTFL
jgi:hypothetical protein